MNHRKETWDKIERFGAMIIVLKKTYREVCEKEDISYDRLNHYVEWYRQKHGLIRKKKEPLGNKFYIPNHPRHL